VEAKGAVWADRKVTLSRLRDSGFADGAGLGASFVNGMGYRV
jgi:hypothetical protein